MGRQIKKLIIGLIVILLFGTIYIFDKKNNLNNEEVPYAAGSNFDIKEVKAFLNNLSSQVLDSGFTENEKITSSLKLNR